MRLRLESWLSNWARKLTALYLLNLVFIYTNYPPHFVQTAYFKICIHDWLFEWWKFESFCSAFLWLCSNLSTATAMLPPQAHCPGHAARWTHKHWKDCRFAPYFVATFEVLLVQLANCNHRHKLQALVHNSLPSTTAIFSYAIGSRKLSPNEQFFAGAHSQITSDICSITDPVAYASSNETKTVWIETELFYQGWMRIMSMCVLGC